MPHIVDHCAGISNIIIIITTIHAINISSVHEVLFFPRRNKYCMSACIGVKHVTNKMYEACIRWDKLFITQYALLLLWIWLSKTDMYHSMWHSSFSVIKKDANSYINVLLCIQKRIMNISTMQLDKRMAILLVRIFEI